MQTSTQSIIKDKIRFNSIDNFTFCLSWQMKTLNSSIRNELMQLKIFAKKNQNCKYREKF